MSIFSKDALPSFFGLTPERYDAETFGELLKIMRTEKELTTSELAEKSSISQSYISQLENNVRLPSDSIIERLSYALIGKDISRSTDSEKKTGKFYFSAESEKKRFDETVNYLKEARNYMKIKDIPGIFNFDDADISLSKDDKQLLEDFHKLSATKKEQLISYLKFLLNS